MSKNQPRFFTFDFYHFDKSSSTIALTLFEQLIAIF